MFHPRIIFEMLKEELKMRRMNFKHLRLFSVFESLSQRSYWSIWSFNNNWSSCVAPSKI